MRVLGAALTAIPVAAQIVWAIAFEWWIVCAWLAAIYLVQGAGILYIIDIERGLSLTFLFIGVAVVVGIPFREYYYFRQDSVFHRLSQKYSKGTK